MKLARQWYFAVFGAIISFRLLCLHDFVVSPFFVPIGGDRALYHNLALALFHGAWFPGVIAFMPLYPVLLGLLYKIIGAPNLAAAAFGQIGLEGCTGLMIMHLALRHYGRLAAVAAGGAYVFFGCAAAYALVTMPVSLGLFWIALTVFFADKWHNNWTCLRAAVMGLLLGCGGQVIGPFWLMVIPFAVWIALSDFKKAGRGAPLFVMAPDGPADAALSERCEHVPAAAAVEVSVFQQWLKYGNSAMLALLVIAGAGATMFPSIVHNYRVEQRFAPVSVHGGLNLYMGNNPASSGYGTALPGLRTSAEEMTADSIKLAGQLAGRSLSGTEAGRFWTRKAFDFWRDAPAQGIILLFNKIQRAVSIRDFDDIGLCRILPEEARLLRGGWVSFGLIWIWACMGFIFAPAPGRGRAAFWIMGLAVMAGMLVTFVTARYRLPLAVLLLPAAAGGVSVVLLASWKAVRRRVRQPFAEITAAIGKRPYRLILGLAGIAVAVLPHSLPDTEAVDHLNKAVYLCRAEKTDAALLSAGTAIACNPGLAEAWFVMGNVLAARTNYAAALQSYERAVNLQGNRSDALFNAGFMLERLGRKKEALAYYQRVTALEPRQAAAWLGQALVYRELGQENSAREAIEKAGEIVGRDHPQIVEFYRNQPPAP